MVILLVLITVLGCITVELILRRREQRRTADESGVLSFPAGVLTLLASEDPPGGLFLHSGHTWAKLGTSGAVQVGLDGFARRILGRIDRFELPAEGAHLRQGEPAFSALQSGKRIEFVSPVDGVVCAVNREINADPQGSKRDPYGKGWAFEVRPSDIPRNLKKLRIGAEASAWVAREARSFSEFLCLHRAVPQEVGITLPDGGIHAEGIMETMDGEILQIAIRKYFR
ncbi:MAG: hypothetical protein A2Z26_05215 [Deltaproteobacteria bacterium RBG_16_66_15]|nr:MAG: hypothetical protein A2X90_04635 [Deltaproteobacteria bacterium GWA2_65_63]OGP27656.1 MAG: hypothetical protein A2X91_06200 [Deltaproteobacteria bacterium GWB2_65_81]OGP39867.1 MAG: hypothetical protein A2X98_03680 [Deltaproteobacteria bacterium GWC2_66_88]OGP78680.1 MAG: hypothetical protein A2Z26_05215 [Deltaproteobacteria bacterium RBG_16_66_15]